MARRRAGDQGMGAVVMRGPVEIRFLIFLPPRRGGSVPRRVQPGRRAAGGAPPSGAAPALLTAGPAYGSKENEGSGVDLCPV